jgi:hypothetical protein
MERVERVSLLEAGIRCGTRIGKSPVCVAEDQTGPIAYEKLQPVKKLEALGATHCSLFESGRLTCEIERGGHALSVVSTQVSDFVIGSADEVYALSTGGNVVANVPSGDAIRTKIVLRGIDSIASTPVGLCGRTFKAEIECMDGIPPNERPTRTVAGMSEVVAIEFGGVVRKKDGTLWVFGDDKTDPFRAFRITRPDGGGTLTALDFGWEPEVCAVTLDGGVSCIDFTRTTSVASFASRRVELPRKAVKIRPRGASCAELDNGTVACWGVFAPELKRLGLRVLTQSPGSIAPRP